MAAFDDQAADDFVVNLLPLNVFYITEVRVMGEYSKEAVPRRRSTFTFTGTHRATYPAN